jgi:hypothetical protein
MEKKEGDKKARNNLQKKTKATKGEQKAVETALAIGLRF